MFTLQTKNTELIAQLLRKYPQQTVLAMQTAMIETTTYIEARIKNDSPAATGLLRDSWTSLVEVSDSGITGIVGTASMYALPVELGSKPHTPPIQPIREWVVLKLGVDDDVERVAWGIVNKIRKYGTKGQFTVQGVIDDKNTALIYEQIIEKHLNRVITQNG